MCLFSDLERNYEKDSIWQVNFLGNIDFWKVSCYTRHDWVVTHVLTLLFVLTTFKHNMLKTDMYTYITITRGKWYKKHRFRELLKVIDISITQSSRRCSFCYLGNWRSYSHGKITFFYSNTMSFVILYKTFLSNDYTPIDYCTLCFYGAYINTGISDSID